MRYPMQTRAPIQQRTRGRVSNLHVIIPQAPAKPKGAVRLRLILSFTPVFKKISLCFLFIFSLSPRNTRGASQGDNVACWGRSGMGENGEVSEGVGLLTPYFGMMTCNALKTTCSLRFRQQCVVPWTADTRSLMNKTKKVIAHD